MRRKMHGIGFFAIESNKGPSRCLSPHPAGRPPQARAGVLIFVQVMFPI